MGTSPSRLSTAIHNAWKSQTARFPHSHSADGSLYSPPRGPRRTADLLRVGLICSLKDRDSSREKISHSTAG
jgi:hypothetical protein